MTGTVHQLIVEAARRDPEGVYALSAEHGEASLTNAALERSCRRVAALLARSGAPAGSTVSAVMPNGINTLRVLLGALFGGCRVNPVNLLSQPEQMRYVLEHSDCSLVVVAPEWEERVRAMLQGIAREVRVLVATPEATSIEGERVEDERGAGMPPSMDDVGLLMYTSGTTGVPKGVMLTQASLAANAHAISAEHALRHGDRVLGVLPLYHINAFVVTMLAPLAHGGSVCIASRFSVAKFWQQAIDHGCTWLNVVPTIVSYLLEAEAPPRDRTAGIRFCRSASAALPPEHLLAFEQKFGIAIVETMGLTETAAPAFSNPMDAGARKVGAVGRASGCTARVVQPDTQAEVPDGTIGEIVIHGPNVMKGYYKNEQATAAAFNAQGWLRTGDLGYRDPDGFFFVTGRIKELIIKGGENIAPREVDEALLRHPSVLEAAAVGVPDRHYGQEIMACVVLRPGHEWDEEAVRAFCVEHLGRYKTPKIFRVMTELPRGPSGKVQRLKLLDVLKQEEQSAAKPA